MALLRVYPPSMTSRQTHPAWHQRCLLQTQREANKNSSSLSYSSLPAVSYPSGCWSDDSGSVTLAPVGGQCWCQHMRIIAGSGSHHRRVAGLSLQQGLGPVWLSNLKIPRVRCWCKKGIRALFSLDVMQGSQPKVLELRMVRDCYY